MFRNSGQYKNWIEIYEKTETDEKDKIGDRIIKDVKKAEFFANIKSLTGSLLSNRPADTVLSKTTHKITYPYFNFPDITADRHFIKFEDKTFSVDYTLDEEFAHEELQVFCTIT